MRLSAAFALTALLSACATTPTSTSEAMPATQVLAADLIVPRGGTGAIVVKRDTSFAGRGCDHRVALDGRPFVDLKIGQIVTVYVRPGQHVLSLSLQGSLCPRYIIEAGAFVEVGQRYAFRTGNPNGWEFAITPTAY